MKDLAKISTIALTHLNNAEYTSFGSRFIKLALSLGAEELGVEAADLTQYNDLLTKLNDLVAQSRASVETLKMIEIDSERNQLGQYIIMNVRKQADFSTEAIAQAATALYVVLKPYVGFYRLPKQQKTATINGMLTDLMKEENAPHVTTLGLTAVVTQLQEKNAQYTLLTDQRAATRAASAGDNSTSLRAEMDALYEYITSVASAKNIITPTESTASFIATLNTIILEVKTSYNQRMAQTKSPSSSGSSSDGDSNSDSDDDIANQYPIE